MPVALADCDFFLSPVALAVAGSGCDVLAVRLLSRAWHAALREHFRAGALQDLQVELNVDALVAALSGRARGEESGDESDEEFLGRPRRPPGELTLQQPRSGGEILCKAFSPCGSALTLVTADHQVRTLDVASGRQIHVLQGHQGIIQSVQYSRCGRWILTASLDGTARTWDAATTDAGVTMSSTSGPLYDATFSPCGQRILTTSFGGEATIWDAQTGEQIHRMEGHASVVFSGEFSADGKTVVTTSKDGSARLWNAETGEELRILGVRGTKLRAATFAPGRPLAVLGVCEDGVLVLWNASDGEELRRWTGHKILGAAFSPCGSRIVVSTRDYSIWLLNAGADAAAVPEGEALVMQSETYETQLVGFSPCGRFLVAGSAGVTGTVRLWNVESREELCAYEVTPGAVSGVNRLGFTPCGGRLLTAAYNGTVRIWGRGPVF